MKVEFEVECTPEEARKFLGLPDVVPMQDAIMKQLQQRLSDNIKQLDPETLVKTWMPMTIQNWTDMQKSFWGQMGKPMGAGFPPSPFTPDFGMPKKSSGEKPAKAKSRSR